MRLSAQQITTIKTNTQRYFGEDASLWLFGSRTNDKKKGGDYDFLIETSLEQPDVIIQHKIFLLTALQMSSSFEDEKIDLIVKRRSTSFDMPIYRVVQKEGIKL
jgi:hypothetical protein